MSETEQGNPELASGWTTANIRKLIGSIRSSIPEMEMEKTRCYRTALPAVDWEKVAFPPFSPEECREKWKDVMEKMRKIRSLPELIAEAEEVISNPLRHRKIHPELPKCPPPPKLLYMWKHFSRCKKEHPGLKMTKIVKNVLKEYDELPDEEKAKYEKEHALKLGEYRKRMSDFCKENNVTFCQKPKPKRRRSANEDEGLPKKPPPNALALFIKEHAKPNTSKRGKSFVTVMIQCWRELSETERQEYNTRCREMKMEYEAKLLQYLDGLDEEEKQQIMEEKGLRLPRKRLRTTLPGEPRMPSQNGFVYFIKDHVTLLKKKTCSQSCCVAEAKKLWSTLSVKEKERYKEQIHKNMKQYSDHLQKWFMTLNPEEQAEYLKQNPSKSRYLDPSTITAYGRKKLFLCQPSDSEDEDIVISEEEEIWSSYEGENEEDSNMFEILY